MKPFYNLLQKGIKLWLVVLLMAVVKSGFGQALLQQDFSAGNPLSNYTSATPNNTKFNSILTSGAGTTISAVTNALVFSRSSGSGTISRSTDLNSPAPTTLKVSFTLSANGSAANNVAQFKIGDGFSATNTPELNSATFGRFSVDYVAGGSFRLRDLITGVASPTFSGTQTITWVLNNSGSAITYIGPNSLSETLPDDRMDIWIGNTVVHNNIGTVTPTLNLVDFKYVINAGAGTMTMDNFNITPAISSVACPAVNPTAVNDIDECSAFVTVAMPVVTGPCAPYTLLNDYNGTNDASDVYAVGFTVITWTITDNCGNTSYCTQNVTVTDTQAPTFTCPSNTSKTTDLNTCTYTISGAEFDVPVTDNCYVDEATVVLSGATTTTPLFSLDGATLNEGVTTITWTATDGAGNINTCSFSVTVSDGQGPTFAGCPGNIIQQRSCAGPVTWTAPTATDNCVGVVSIVSSHNSGDNFPVGTTTVTYTATDIANNSSTCSFDVVINAITLTTSSPLHNGFNISCKNGNDGAIDLTVTNAVGSPSYSWTGPGGFTASTEDLSGLVAGTYNVTVTDLHCTTSTSITLTEPTGITGSATLSNYNGVNVSCFGGSDGTANITALGGVGGFTYSLDGGTPQGSPSFTGINAGSHSVLITDLNGCTLSVPFTLTQPAVALTASAGNNGPVHTGATLNLTSTVGGGTPTYSYSWTGPNGFTSAAANPSIANVTSVANGVYTVVVTDFNNCTATATTTPLIYSDSLYVNDNSLSGDVYTTAIGNDANPGTTSQPFATIAHAISVATANSIIFVDGGTYAEAVTADKALDIRGRDYNQNTTTRFAAFVAGPDGLKGSGSSESILTAPSNNPLGGNPGANDLIRITASGVKINGFTIDGNNPTLGASANTGNGVNIHARRGVTNIDNSNNFNPVSNLEVRNNIIQNISQRGVSLANNGPVTTGSVIDGNIIRNFGSDPVNGGQGVILFTNAYADITNNTIDVSTFNIGLHLQNFFQNGTMSWSNNNITVGQDGIGVHVNLFYAPAATLNISNNTVNAASGVTAGSEATWGINLWSTQVGSTITATNNLVGTSGGTFDRGINLWNLPTTNTVTVSGGTVGNSAVGINLDNVDIYYGSGSTTTVNVSGTAVSGGSVGARVRTDALSFAPCCGSNTPAGSSTLNLNNVSISGATTGVEVTAPSTSGVYTATLGVTGTTSVSGATTGLLVSGSNTAVAGNTLGTSSIAASSKLIVLSNGALAGQTLNATATSLDGSVGSAKSLNDNFTTEDKIDHKIDNSALGYVSVKANHDFVTTNSFVSPNTSALIQRGVDAATAGYTVNVNSGTYNEDVNVNKQLSVIGAGYSTTTVSGPIGGPTSTFAVNAAGIIIDGFAITRDGNNPLDWTNPSLNLGGATIQGQTNNAEIRNCSFYGNRSAIDINNSNGNSIHNNLIDNNRTGVIFRNQTDNTNFQENFVTNNWTAGILFLDGSGGSNSPVQTAINSNFNNNNISGNWYGDVVDRQFGGSLPAPGVNAKNFECNWYGQASAPVVTTSNSTEPGYAAQIPVIYGGSAVAPGPVADILGGGSANVDFISWLVDGTDNAPATSGFQPVGGACSGTPLVIGAFTQTNVSCNGGADGSATVNYTGGTSPYSYLWSNGQTSVTATGLIAGTYSVTVTDVNGSTANASVTITEPTVLTASAGNNGPVHTGATLNLTSTVGGGTPTYSYNWTGPNGFTSAAANPSIANVTSVANGVYTVVVTDFNNCTATATTTPLIYSDSLYVNDNSLSGDVYTTAIGNDANPGTTSQPFATIAHAISVATANSIIFVDAGTHLGTVTVDKTLDIRGSNYGISPNGGIRVAEANVVPASAAISSGEIFHVAASNVSINGFTIDGDNTAITSGFSSTNGADMDAAEGVTVYETGINNLNVSNNIIQNLSYFGVTLYDYPAGVPSSGHIINNNKIQNLGTYDAGSGIDFWGGAVLLYNNQYAAVTNNVMSNVRIGIQTGNFYQANPGGPSSQVIDNNTISARRRGIFHNLAYSSASGYTLSNNSISGIVNANELYFDGILLSSLSVPSTSTNNSVNGTAISNPKGGIVVWNVSSATPTAISGGTITGVDNGLFVNNYDGYPSTGSNAPDGGHASVSGLTITNCTTGIRVKDNTLSSHAAVSLTFGAGVSVSGGTDGLVVENASASVTNTNNLSISTQSNRYIRLIANAGNIDATSTTFDGLTGGSATLTQNFDIEDKIDHKVDNSALGFVLVKANNDYVTLNSFVTPNTTPSIQRGIDAASAGYTVNVRTGDYGKEIAANRSVFGVGSYNFGLYIDKDNVTVRGYGAGDAAITNPASASVEFFTGSDANFGPSGIFVQSNGVTLDGLQIKDNLDNSNAVNSNKSIEVIGDAFSMTNSWLNTSSDQGAFYMGIWDNLHPISTYTIDNNKFTNALVSINNGAGQTGLASGRSITNNTFDGFITPYLIGFRGWNGANPAQGWIVYPVGGAVVTGNVFNNTNVDNYILVRGNTGGYDNSQFNWADIWNLNTYGNHVVTLSSYPSFAVRSFDSNGYTDSRRITPEIQENESIGQTGDHVLVSAGTFNENVIVTHAVTLRGNNYQVTCDVGRAAESIISGSAQAAVTINSDGVVVNGFTITNPTGKFGIYTKGTNNITVADNIITNVGNNVSGSGATYGVAIEAGSSANMSNINIADNCVNNIRGGQNTSLTGLAAKNNNGSGVGIGAGFSTAAFDISGLTITGNKISAITACIDPFNSGGKGAYGVNINVGASNSFAGKAISPLVGSNEITSIEGLWAHAVGLEGETPGATVINNTISSLTDHKIPTDAIGVMVEDNAGSASVLVNNNSFTNVGLAINNLTANNFNATCNWYGTLNAMAIAALINGPVTYASWLVNGTDNSAATGFQPVGGACSGLPLSIAVVQTNVDCNGNSTGALDITVTGGTAPASLSYAWSNLAITEDLSGLAAGTYTVTVTDGNGSTATATYTITQPDVLAATGTQTNVLCFGNSTGAIDLSVTGGTSPYTYAWSNGDVTEDISGLVAGTYSVTITDDHGCTTTASFTILQPAAPLSLTSTQVNVLCFGGNTGSVDLSVSGGTASYSYLWSNGALTEDISGLTAGTYTVTVTDANGCSTSTSVTITQPAAGLSATSLQNIVTCNGGSDGNVNLTVAGGTTAYSYLWSNATTSEDLSNVTAGLYTVTVTDANGCTLSHNVTITEATPIALSSTSLNASCFGDSDGSVNLSVSGGGTSTAAPVGMDGVIGAEWTGTSMKVVNYNPAAPTGNFGSPTGQNHVVAYQLYTRQDANYLYVACQTNSALGGAANASVRFANIYFGGNTSIGFETGVTPTQAFLPGVPGSYPVASLSGTPYEVFTSTDFSGSEYVIELAVPLAFVKDDPLGVGFTKLDGTSGKSFARISLSQSFGYSVAGGQATYGTNRLGYYSIPNNIIDNSYTYSWSNGAVTQDLSGLTAGTYTVTVTDDLGCTANTSVTINEPIQVTINATSTNVSCFGLANGTITATASAGASITVDGYGYNPFATYGPGTYTIVATAPNGNNDGVCTATTTVTITEPIEVTINATSTNVSCFGLANGTITATASAGASITVNGNPYNPLANYGPGTYTVVATAPNGNNDGSCTATTTVTITEPIEVTITASATNVSCFGAADGIITATGSAGSTITVNGNPLANPYGPGTYVIVATAPDGNNIGTCSASTTVIITEPIQVTVSASATNVSCNGAADGVITASGSAGSVITVNGNPLANPYGPGTYTIVASAPNGNNNGSCTAVTTVTITEPIEVTVSASATNVSCNGAADGVITASGSAGSTITVDGNPLANPYGPGTYTVVATAPNGNNDGFCTATTTVTITEPILVTVSASATNVSCNGAADGVITASGSAGSTITVNGNPLANPYGPGTYTVVATAPNGNNNGSCTATTTVTITEPILVTVSASSTNVTCNGAANGTITASGSAGSTITVNGNPLSNPYGPGTYTVVATTPNGNNDGFCTATTTVTITQPAVLTASTSGVNVTCNGSNNGSASVVAGGGTSPYTYAWSNGGTTSTISGLSPGTYTATVTDANGCITVGTPVVITQPNALSLGVTAVNVTCFGAANGSVSASPSFGTPGYTYQWNTGATTPAITNLGPGTFTVTVTDANGCSITGSAQVFQPGSALNLSTSKTNVTCPGGANGTANVAVSGGWGSYTYVWNTSPVKTTPNVTGLVAGIYSVIVTDGGGCTKSATVVISQPAAITNNFTKPAAGQMKANPAGGTPGYSYLWNTGAVTQTISGVTIGVVYTVTVTDSRGCKATFSAPATRMGELSASNSLGANAYPNPTKGELNIDFTAVASDRVEIRIFDMTGRIVFADEVTSTEGINHLNYSLDGISSGIYSLSIQRGDDNAVIRLMVE